MKSREETNNAMKTRPLWASSDWPTKALYPMQRLASESRDLLQGSSHDRFGSNIQGFSGSGTKRGSHHPRIPFKESSVRPSALLHTRTTFFNSPALLLFSLIPPLISFHTLLLPQASPALLGHVIIFSSPSHASSMTLRLCHSHTSAVSRSVFAFQMVQ